jgi:hypothetical protein
MRLLVRVLCVFFATLATVSAGVIIIDKVPDQSAYWHPLSGSGTYVYADSFVFTGGPTDVATTLGIYLLMETPSAVGSSIRFELWGDNGNSPDSTAVLGVTGYFQDAGPSLHLATANLVTPVTLLAGSRYWVIGSAVGQTDQGSYQVGGHTQNSIYSDNGTFWYSNDPNGISFGGEALLPEMAIYVAGGGNIPEPGTFFLLGAGLVSVALLRRRAA